MIRPGEAFRGTEDLINAWAYVRSHRSDIDLQIHENEEA